MNVLSIGNSFSQDAQKYLAQVSKSLGEEIYCENLYIGGCTLKTHCENLENNAQNYDLEICGSAAVRKISISEAVLSRKWDVITLQQASHESFDIKTYLPYIKELAAYIRENSDAKIFVHQTWGYETGSEKIAAAGYETLEKMTADVVNTYEEAAKIIGADKIIPSGRAMLELEKSGIAPHRDTFHANYGYGRYMLALVWLGTLTGKTEFKSEFCDFDISVSAEEKAAAEKAAQSAINLQKN